MQRRLSDSFVAPHPYNPFGPDEIESLYDAYGRQAFGLALRILGDRQAAEDVVQEAYLAVWRHALRFDPAKGSLRGWLLTIVRNKAIDQLGRRSHRQQWPGLEAAANAAADDDPERAALTADERTEIRDALRQLSGSQRRTLELSYFAGLSHSEIAQEMGVPLGTVKGRARSGLERMRNVLDAREVH